MAIYLPHDHLVRKAVNDELLRQAQRYRTARLVQADHTSRNRLFCCALNWLGGRLIAWGQRLRDRYGPSLPAPAFQTS